jgi:integrase
VITGGWMKKAQQVFLLQVNFWGMRIGDILTLKPDQIRDGILRYRMRKTGDEFTIKVSKEAQKILSEICLPNSTYLLPFVKEKKDDKKIGQQVSNYTTILNRYLKVVALRAGIEKEVSTHSARRSWIQMIIVKTNGNYKIAQWGAGHSSAIITEVYSESPNMDLLNEINLSMMAG